MAVEPSMTVSESSRWDPLTYQLSALREKADRPSYAEIARRVSDRRKAQGMSPEAAKIARSSIFDAFGTGRTRINLGLVREIAAVLGADSALVDDWIRECQEGGVDEVDPPPTPATWTVALVVACIVINMFGRELVNFLDLPLYFDMFGTAIAAIALGPWHGVLVGGGTNLIGSVTGSGLESVPFGLVNVAGALLWGYGVRRFGMGRTVARFFGLNLIVAAVCSAISVCILLGLYGGSVGHGQDVITDTFYDLTGSLGVSVAASNLLTSVIDKLVTGFAVLVFIVSVLPIGLRGKLRSVMVMPAPVLESPAPGR